MSRLLRRAAVGVVAALGVAAPPVEAATCTVSSDTRQCGYLPTGSEETFVVPSGVTFVGVFAIGAGGAIGGPRYGDPGHGAFVIAGIAVTPGQVLYVNVGGLPDGDSSCGDYVKCVGGFNGGGAGGGDGGGGGGASDVRTISRTEAGSLTSRIVVAGGGGGGGDQGDGCLVPEALEGDGGDAGQAGDAGRGCEDLPGGTGGGAGTDTSGGAGGSPGGLGGQLGTGGAGAGGGGGGGGGGYYGGGGGGGRVFSSTWSSSGAGGGGGGSSYVDPSVGHLLDSEVWSEVRGGLVIIGHPTGPACDAALSPVGCWSFGEESGLTASDASTFGNDGTYTNGPVLGAAGAIPDGDTAVSLDGRNDYVVTPDDDSLDVGDSFSLEGWILRDTDAKTHQMFNKGGSGFHLVVMDGLNDNSVWLRKANHGTIVRSAGGVPADGRYHHVVATKDGPGSAQIYIDGVQQSLQQVSPGHVIQNTAFGLFFSATQSGNPIAGDIDEYAVYDRPLTPDEVRIRFERGAATDAERTTATGARVRSRPGRRSSAGSGTCRDLGKPDAGVTGIRVSGLSCAEGERLVLGGAKHRAAAGLDCVITHEDFSGPVVRITRECAGSAGRRLRYTTLS